MSKQGNIPILEENQLEEAKNINIEGNKYFKKGEYEKALTSFQTSLRLRLNILGKNHLDVADSYNNIGNTFYYKGLYDKALFYHSASKDIKIKLLGEDNIALATTFNGIGICYDAQGLYSKALAYYNKSLDLRMSCLGEEHPSIAQSYNNLGLCYYSKGTFDNALIYLRKSLYIRQKHFGEHHWSVAQTFLNMGACFFRKYEYDESLCYYQKSLKLKQTIYGKNHLNVAIVLDNIGFCYRRKKMFDVALPYHYQVLEIRQSVLAQDHPSLAITFNNIANCLFGKGHFEDALDYFQKALQVVIPEFLPQKNTENPSIQQYMDPHILLEILQSKAACLQEMNRRESMDRVDGENYGNLALNTYRLAAKLMTQLRRGYKAESTHLTLAKKAHEMYEAAIDVAIENNAEDLAFAFAEQGKGMVLLGSFKDIDAQLAANIPQKWLDEAYDLRIALTELDHTIGQERNKIEVEQNNEQLRRWRNQHFDYQRRYEKLIKKLEREYPDYFQLKYDVDNTSIHELQETLDCQTAIIEFFVGRRKTYIFTIGCDFVNIQSIDIKETRLNEWVGDLIEAIYAENVKEYKELAYSLYQHLLKKNLDNDLLKDIQNLYIIPDGDLNFLPFETLLTQREASKAYSEFPFLVNKYAITYHYSATLWHYGKTKLQQNRQNLPSFSFVGFAPVYQDSAIGYETLHYSIFEIEGIRAAFEAKGHTTDMYLHLEASKAHFKQFAANYKYVHIAAHALSQSYFEEEEERYASEGIVFSSSIGEEGVLSMAEIYNFSLAADLVVLSCCDSGVGKVVKGEGVMAINRGFLYAGAKNVIYTLFKVYDRHSTELMQYLYQDILENKGYSQSLRTSKLKMIHQNYAPKYWSGFVHIGE